MAKSKGIQWKIDWCERIISLAETMGRQAVGTYFDMVPDTITWLWKWKHISREQMESWCDRVTDINERELSLNEERASLGDGWW